MRHTTRIIFACLLSVLVFAATSLVLTVLFHFDNELAFAFAGAALAVVGIPLGVWVAHGPPGARLRIRPGTWTMEDSSSSDIPRPELTDRLVTLLGEGDGKAVGLTTALVGAGGFGKTNLARQLCADPRVRTQYHAGVWVSMGQRPSGVELAGIINDVYYQLTGDRPALVDPSQAGRNLGQLLDGDQRVLLVLDDIWRDEQLRPFLQGGRRCTRLVTTRRPGVLPGGLERGIKVDELSRQQATQLLTAKLPAIESGLLDELIRLTGKWPLLVELANRHLCFNLEAGTDVDTAAASLAARLSEDGPDALDLADEVSRDKAAAASINASLDLLKPSQDFPYDGRQLFMQLGIFAEDSEIDRLLLIPLWRATQGLTPGHVDRFCDRLYGLSLVAAYRPTKSIRLHDIVRAYIRAKSRLELGQLNQLLLESANALLKPSDAYRVLEVSSEDIQVTPWWRLPSDLEYLWQNLCSHLAAAQDDNFQLLSLLLDLRWAEARIWRFGLAALEADLALSDDPRVVQLRNVIRQNANSFVIKPGHTRWLVANSLVFHLRGVEELASSVESYLPYLPGEVRDRYSREPLIIGRSHGRGWNFDEMVPSEHWDPLMDPWNANEEFYR